MTDPIENGIARLLRETGPRPPVPADRAARVENHVRDHWRRTIAARRRRTWHLAGIAASIVLVAVAAFALRRDDPARPVAFVEGGVATAGDPATRDVGPGAVIATREGERIALRAGTGHSVRLNVSSRVRVVSARSLTLEAGALYVDSGGAASVLPVLEVQTPRGRIEDTGTQFEARLDGDALEVRVREGRVVLFSDRASVTISAGAALRSDARGSRALEAEPASGPGWSWAADAAPRPVIEGRSLASFLAWYGREQGLAVRYATPEVLGTASRTILRGSIEGMSVDEGLRSVLATSAMRADRSGSELLVDGL